MAYIGFFALGIFVGNMLALGIRHISDWSKPKIVLTTFLGAAFSGAVLAFIQALGKVTSGESLFMYPVGLLYGQMWYYADAAVAHIRDPDGGIKLVGWLHVAGLAISTVFAALVLLSEDFRQRLPADKDHGDHAACACPRSAGGPRR